MASSSDPQYITPSRVKWLLRRGGVRRIGDFVYEDVRLLIQKFAKLSARAILGRVRQSRDTIRMRHAVKGLKDIGLILEPRVVPVYMPEHIIPKTKIGRIVRHAFHSYRPHIKMTSETLQAIHYIIEVYVVSIIRLAVLRATREGRDVVTTTDMTEVSVRDLSSRALRIDSGM